MNYFWPFEYQTSLVFRSPRSFRYPVASRIVKMSWIIEIHKNYLLKAKPLGRWQISSREKTYPSLYTVPNICRYTCLVQTLTPLYYIRTGQREWAKNWNNYPHSFTGSERRSSSTQKDNNFNRIWCNFVSSFGKFRERFEQGAFLEHFDSFLFLGDWVGGKGILRTADAQFSNFSQKRSVFKHKLLYDNPKPRFCVTALIFWVKVQTVSRQTFVNVGFSLH